MNRKFKRTELFEIIIYIYIYIYTGPKSFNGSLCHPQKKFYTKIWNYKYKLNLEI